MERKRARVEGGAYAASAATAASAAGRRGINAPTLIAGSVESGVGARLVAGESMVVDEYDDEDTTTLLNRLRAGAVLKPTLIPRPPARLRLSRNLVHRLQCRERSRSSPGSALINQR